MNLYDALCAIAAFLIMITALARLNDIRRDRVGLRWWVRRTGLLMVFVSMAMFVSAFVTINTPYWFEIRQMLGLWGVLLTWMTTPDHPPWHRWISRNDPPGTTPYGRRKTDADHGDN